MQYAGAWKRWSASLTDGFIIGVLTFIFTFTVNCGAEWLNVSAVKDASLFDIGSTVGLGISFVYSLAIGSSWQATPGMRRHNIYVIKSDGGRIDYLNAVYRYAAFSAPLLFDLQDSWSFWIIGVLTNILWFVPIAYTKEKTGIHDMICKTRVVRGKPSLIA
jgi:uncharacterized RDD family membrane protein YckC